MSIEDEIANIDFEMSRLKKNKSTEHYIGCLHARLARIRERQESSGGGSKGVIFSVKKQGNATVAFVGFPSVGKSTLLNALTNADSKVASYEFTTLRPIPGMLFYKKTKIQLIDAPGIIEGASEGKGMGRQIISALRTADLILILIEPGKVQLPVIEKELYNSGVRLNMNSPNLLIKRTDRGGVIIESTVKQELDNETFIEILKEYGYVNAYIVLREKLSIDRFIDALSHNRVYIPSILAINKSDKLSSKELKEMKKKYPKSTFISSEKNKGLDDLKEAIYNALSFKRVYLKEQGKEPDFNDPLIMRGLVTVDSVAKKVRKVVSSAKVWGKSVKHEGQIVSLKHELADEDIVTLEVK